MSMSPLTTQEAIQRLHETRRQDAPFEEKAREALELGEQYLGVDNGHLARVVTATDYWEATVSTDTRDGQVPPGLERDLENTLCRRTIAADTPVSRHDISSEGPTGDGIPGEHEVGCYHGTTVYLDEELYGTLCFVGEESREEPFSDDETIFVELVTRLLEQELEQKHHSAELTRRNNLVNVLNRVLRHNLRNEMTIRPRDGEAVVCRDHMGVLPYDGDEFNGSVGTLRDITAHKERERSLSEARTVFENTQDALFLIDVTDGTEFVVQEVNAVYEELTGLSNEGMQGKTPREIVGEDDGSEIEARYRECLRRRETIEYPETIPVAGEQRHWKTKLTPVLEDGSVVKLVGAMRADDDREV